MQTEPKLPVSISGIGVWLPETERLNSWWPSSVVQAWERQTADRNLMSDAAGSVVAEVGDLPGVRATLAAMAEIAGDPFHGIKRRQVLPGPMPTVEMEQRAAQRALSDAGIVPEAVGLLIQHSTEPEDPTVPQATKLHDVLGLQRDCLSVTLEAGANSFLQQLLIASQFISTGSVDYALLVQSSNYSQLIPPEEQYSAWFGDAATAVVLTRDSAGGGILGFSCHTDGSYYRAYTSTNPLAKSRQGNAITIESRQTMRRMLLTIADTMAESMQKSLGMAEVSAGDIDFYASHQATVWFRPVTQQLMGLNNAHGYTTTVEHGTMNSCNIPFGLRRAIRDKVVVPGALVAFCAGGAGITQTTLVMRWGGTLG